MEYTKLGNTGLDVSRICLGCMGFGTVPEVITKWTHDWVINEEESRRIIKRAHELGVNFFDTANCYSAGTSEEFLGRAIKGFNRDELVIATKVYIPVREGPNGGGLSRKHILAEIDKSLKRLGLDYVDLYIIHRWDYKTPIEETMSALHDVVKAGKARYIGASAMYAWQFQKALYTAERLGFTKFISMQNHWNLIYREEEREMAPLCRDAGVSCTPYSPLASGRLARPWSESTKRADTDAVFKMKYGATEDVDKPIVNRVKELAEKYGVPIPHISTAWLLQKETVAAAIVGATKTAHIEQAVSALSVKLTAEDVNYLEELYVPHKVVGAL
jgi:aryl-alcohol dehydrogenase-like predicted oxidoreductase